MSTIKAFVVIDDEQKIILGSIKDTEKKADKFATDLYGYDTWEHLKRCGAQVTECEIKVISD